MSKKIAISGYYGFDNFGDEGILGILVKNLKDSGVADEITIFSHNPQITSKRYDVKSIKTFSFFKIIDALRSTDILISGGGSLLQDATSLKSLFYYLWVILLALYYKKKVIIFAQGIGPINNPLARLITKMILKHCSYISVRDEKSLFLLRGWGISPYLVNDPMWNIELTPNFPSNRVGIQLRKWKTLTEEFLLALAKAVSNSYSDKQINIYSFQDSQDYDVCKRFEGYLKLNNPSIKTTILHTRSNREIIESFKYLNVVIAMRYHACLLALKYGIKTLPLSYDEKVEKLAGEISIPFVKLNEKDKIQQYIEKLDEIDIKELQNKVKEMEFDFNTMFNVINS